MAGRTTLKINEPKNVAIRKPEILENYYQVVIGERIEGASIGKVGKRMDCHSSPIIHYFKITCLNEPTVPTNRSGYIICKTIKRKFS